MISINQHILSSILSAYELGTLLVDPVVIRKNRVWKIKTDKGSFKIKHLHSHELQGSHQGDRIANVFKENNIPAETALWFSQSPLFFVDEKYFMVFPWHEGSVSEKITASTEEAFQIGVLLARIHSLNQQMPKASHSAWQNFVVPDWNDVLKKALEKKMSCTQTLENALPELIEWSALYQTGQDKLDNARVLSHGDLFPANVVWSEKLSPFIIDWEAAGYIHPQLELWNVGLNWGGILVDDVRPEFFTALLEGYRSLKRPVFFDENMVHTGLGSWLAWLMYKLSGYSFDTDITIEDDIEIIRRIIKTYPVLLSLRGV